MYFQVHCTQLNTDYEFIMKSYLSPSIFPFFFSVINSVSFSDLLLTLFFSFFFTEYVELHQFSLDRQCSLNFHHLLSFYFIYFLNQTPVPSGKCSWVRFDYYFNPSTFLIGRNNNWSRNSGPEYLFMYWSAFPSFPQKICMSLLSRFFSSPMEREYWHYLNSHEGYRD